MNFKEKGWIKRYLNIRNQYALHKEFARFSEGNGPRQNPEEFLYQLLQPTGVLYGFPSEFPLQNKSLVRALKIESLSQGDRTKIILLESFLHSALISPRYQSLENAIDMADAILDSAHLIGKFYRSVYQGLETRSKHWFYYKERRGLHLSEYVLENKIYPKPKTGKFWGNFFNSSLTFLDVFYFGRWIYAEKPDIEHNQITIAHEQMRLLILEVIVAAALANGILEPEEKKLFDYFMEAAMFSMETKDAAYKYLNNPVSLEDLNLEQLSSQILKKYLYELAVLVIYADKLLTEEEKRFMELLRQKLKLGKDEVESSQLSVESFIISHWQQMELLQNHHHFTSIQEQVLDKMAGILSKNKEPFLRQVQNNQELLSLLKKASKSKLTKEEKSRTCQGLNEALRTLPHTLLNAVPKSFFTYPIWMQILPEDIVLMKSDTYPPER